MSFQILPIRTTKVATGIRTKNYKFYDNSFFELNSDLYYIPIQNLSTTFSIGRNSFKKTDKQLFLNENFNDVFSNKDFVLVNPSFNFILSTSLKTNVYSINYNDVYQKPLYFLTHFVKPSYDNNDLYNDLNNFGIAFDDPNDTNSEQYIYNYSIYYNSELIVSILFSNLLSGTEIIVKHPIFIEKSFTLPYKDESIQL